MTSTRWPWRIVVAALLVTSACAALVVHARIRPLDAGPLYVELGEPAMRRGSSVDYTDVWYGSGKGRVELRVRSDSVSVFRQGHETAVQAQARVARAGSSVALPLLPVE
jgi:hypothetical protein